MAGQFGFRSFIIIKLKKKKFFNWKWGATLKLKINRNYYVCERDCSPLNALLFALKFGSFSQIYFLK